MKFTNGYWLSRENTVISTPQEIRDISIYDGKLELYAATKYIRHRGDTLDGIMLTFEYSSPIPDVICVKVYHHKGGINRKPSFEIHRDKQFIPEILDNGDNIIFSTGKLQMIIKKTPGWRVDFLYDGRHFCESAQKSTAYINVKGDGAYMREQLSLGVGEYIYGLGERFTPFVRNGQIVDIWNEDGGTSSEQSYKNIPFYLSSRGYGVFVNSTDRVSYEIASECVSSVQFSVPGEYLEYYIIGGGSPKAALSNYTRLTGRPSLPPAWSFGLWLTTSFTTSYDEKTVTSFIDGMAQRELPLHVFHFDCFWMKEYQWCNFEWDKEVFPEPEKMLERLKARGLKICVWINPYIAQRSMLFDEGMENGYLLKKADGSVWQWDRWQAGMGLVDFTNPQAAIWYKSKLKRLLDMGVDCFKTDFGERIPTDVVYYDGSDPVSMHNYYTYLYNKAVFELLEEQRGKDEAALFARSATVGCQSFPVHWGGDCSASYNSMAESLRGGLSLCTSGFGFWSHDISGFESTATPDIYKRWTAFGLLSTHSRLHGNESYRVPWLFDEEAVDVLRYFTKLKCSIMPYLFSAACEVSQTGIPAMRAMVLEFPEDRNCQVLDRQYMLGSSLLVAPIFNEEGNAEYYLPGGTWTNFISGDTVEGGSWKREKHGYMSLPLMVRENSIIAVGNINTKPDYDYASEVELQIFALKAGKTASTVIYDVNGKPELQFSANRTGNVIRLEANGTGKPWSAVLKGISNVSSAEGADVCCKGYDTMVYPEDYCGIIELVLQV